MMPLVTFIVPCYRLAHLVGDCVGSILGQTVDDLEVLVMDDCSPDDVAGTLQSFAGDRRLRHVRHARNLGHLRNYNRGLDLARGRYVWLISADDRLCRADAVEVMTRALEANPGAAFAFSPARRFGEGASGERYGNVAAADAVFPSAEFAISMLHGNPVPAPCAVARGECYRAGLRFPLDLPFVGDWYIWAHLALRHDVAYVAEPVAEYRVHAGNMTKRFHADPHALVADEIAVKWKLRREAETLGRPAIACAALDIIAWDYANRIGSRLRGVGTFGMTLDALERSLDAHRAVPVEAAFIRGRAYAAAADAYLELGDRDAARTWYDRSLQERRDKGTWIKRQLLTLGTIGDAARRLA